MKKYFIAGTDTEVGKTYVSCLISEFLKNNGYSIGTLKPIETGLKYLEEPDFKKISKASGDREKIVYGLSEPLAPLIAAEIDKIKINKNKILNFFNKDISSHKYDYYLIEGAGGLFVPLTENLLYIDLINEFNCEVILVARTNLGTVNHTLLSIEALKRRNIGIKGIILNEIVETDEFMIKNNVRMIEKFSGCKVLSIIKKNQKKIFHIEL